MQLGYHQGEQTEVKVKIKCFDVIPPIEARTSCRWCMNLAPLFVSWVSIHRAGHKPMTSVISSVA